jgi:hypothetical protein
MTIPIEQAAMNLAAGLGAAVGFEQPELRVAGDPPTSPRPSHFSPGRWRRDSQVALWFAAPSPCLFAPSSLSA